MVNKRKTSKFFNLGEASKGIYEPFDDEIGEVGLLKMLYIGYGKDAYEEARLDSVLSLSKRLGTFDVNWINIESSDAASLQPLAELFSLHELAIEDCTKFHQRSKIDSFPQHLFIILRIPTDKEHSCDTEQIALFLGSNYVISFQEKSGGDCLEPVRDRIRKSAGQIRQRGADYLAYAIIDAGIDAYFPMMERMGDRIEALEESIVSETRADATGRIHQLKLEVLAVRRSVWPMRDTINTLCRDSVSFVKDETRVYLRDCYDHLSRIIDLVEMYRELSTDLLNIYLSSVNNRMNEIIKVLTVITSLFIPPTFIAGVYGMNFKTEASPFNMPELNWYFGYPIALAVMLATSLAILFFLKRKRWL